MTEVDPGRFPANTPVPEITFATVGDGDVTVGGAKDAWTLLVVYRGKHCPLCKNYLNQLEEMKADWAEAGFDIVTVSADPMEKAKADVDEFGWTFPVGIDLKEADMRRLGLYVSDPLSEKENDRRFAEPGLYCISPEGKAQIVAISNSPAARPGLDSVLKGMKFNIANNRPPRGQA